MPTIQLARRRVMRSVAAAASMAAVLAVGCAEEASYDRYEPLTDPALDGPSVKAPTASSTHEADFRVPEATPQVLFRRNPIPGDDSYTRLSRLYAEGTLEDGTISRPRLVIERMLAPETPEDLCPVSVMAAIEPIPAMFPSPGFVLIPTEFQVGPACPIPLALPPGSSFVTSIPIGPMGDLKLYEKR